MELMMLKFFLGSFIIGSILLFFFMKTFNQSLFIWHEDEKESEDAEDSKRR